MTKKAWIIFAAVCIAIIAALVYISQGKKIDVSTVDTKAIQAASEQNGNTADHVYGKADSKVVLIEYGDYQCPGCSSAYPIMKEVAETYKDKIAFVFRNYPLYTAHPNAFAAAATAEAAAVQGKFWEMHDYLYENQSSWKDLTGAQRTDFFASAANSLGLDGEKLRTQLTDAQIKRKINFDEALGKKDGVTGTPSFFLNGKNVGELYFKDDKIVAENVDGAELIWTNADAFGKLVLDPILKENNITPPSHK